MTRFCLISSLFLVWFFSLVPAGAVFIPVCAVISFCLMLVIGLGNKIFQVLQFQPMYNYPLFVNMLTTFIYIPASFAYIIPMIYWGEQITPEAQKIPKMKFAVMGLLDSIAGIMQSLAVNYIADGTLVVLLSQAAIPISMIISKIMLKTKYRCYQFMGALIVFVGLGVVLGPDVVHPDSTSSGTTIITWSGIMFLSCVPMTLSSVYKEIALGAVELDAVYLNGWIALFQFGAAIPLLLPSAPASNISIKDLPGNLWDGAKCLIGHNTIDEVASPKHYDDCSKSLMYVSIYMCFNLGYNVLIILILKFGSANILWLAMTVMVPLGSLAFSLPFMPNSKSFKLTDIIGLVVIMLGLIVYRFYGPVAELLDKYIFRNKIQISKFMTATPGGTEPEPDYVYAVNPSGGGTSTPNMGVVGAHSGSHGHVKQERWKENKNQRMVTFFRWRLFSGVLFFFVRGFLC